MYPTELPYLHQSHNADYLPLYRLEDIFQRQGFEISRATQSVWSEPHGPRILRIQL